MSTIEDNENIAKNLEINPGNKFDDHLLSVNSLQINENKKYSSQLSADSKTNKKKNKRKRRKRGGRTRNKKRQNNNNTTNDNEENKRGSSSSSSSSSTSSSTALSLSIPKSPLLKGIKFSEFAYNCDIDDFPYFPVSQSCPIGYCDYKEIKDNHSSPYNNDDISSIPLTPELETAFTDFFVGNNKDTTFPVFDDISKNETKQEILLSQWITNLDLDEETRGNTDLIKQIIIKFADDTEKEKEKKKIKSTELLNFKDIDRELGIDLADCELSIDLGLDLDLFEQDDGKLSLKLEEINLSPAEFEDDEIIYNQNELSFETKQAKEVITNKDHMISNDVHSPANDFEYELSPECSYSPCILSGDESAAVSHVQSPAKDCFGYELSPEYSDTEIMCSPETIKSYDGPSDINNNNNNNGNNNGNNTPCMLSPDYKQHPISDYHHQQQMMNHYDYQYSNMNNNNMMFTFPAPSTPPPPPPEIEEIPDFSNYSIHEIIKKNLTLKELIKYNLILRLSSDQHGSRMVQNKLKYAKNDDVISMISLLIHYFTSNNINLNKLSEDIFGNYVIQLLFQRGNMIHHGILLKYFVYNNILKLSITKNGCRVIQTIFKSITNLTLLCKLVDSFKDELMNKNNHNYTVRRVLQCVNGNRVLQSMIEQKLPYKYLSFLCKEFESDLLYYCQEINACRVLQSYLNVYGDKINFNSLFTPNSNYLKLVTNVHGNYTIQCIIRNDKWYSNSSSEIIKFRNKMIYDMFAEKNIEYFSTNKHGSNVIETCIRSCTIKHIEYLLNVLCRKKGMLLTHLMSDKFGNYIPKTLLENIPKNNYKLLKLLINTLQKYIIDLYNYDCHYHQQFKHCQEFIISAQKIQQQLQI